MSLLIYTLHDEGELNSKRSKRIRDIFVKQNTRFRCGRCAGMCEVNPGVGKQPDTIGCFTCGGRWFGYILPSVMQSCNDLIRARERAIRDNLSNADIRTSLGEID